MPRSNSLLKLAIPVDVEVHSQVLAAAARDRISASDWMSNAVPEALFRRAGLAAVARWESRYGHLDEKALMDARRFVRTQLEPRRRGLRSA